MQKSRKRAGARFATCAALIIAILVAIAAALNLRSNAELSAHLEDMEARSKQRDVQLESEVEGISQQLDMLSGGMYEEIAAARHAAQGEASRLGSRLSSSLSTVRAKLDEMAKQFRTQTAEAATPPEASTVPPTAEPAVTVTAAPAPVSEAALKESVLSSKDLQAISQLREGKLLFESAKYEQAQKLLHEALLLQPDNTDAMLYYAASLYRTNPSDSSAYSIIEKNLRVTISRDGDSPLALETLAMVAMERQNWPDAMDYLRRLITVRPENAAFLKMAGYCSLKSGDLESARDYFQAACVQAPLDGEALTMLGDCESGLGDAEKAEADWKVALSTVDPKTANGSRKSIALREKLASSAYGRGAFDESMAYSMQKEKEAGSTLLRAYEGLNAIALGNATKGIAILKEVSASTDPQASALADKGLTESGQ